MAISPSSDHRESQDSRLRAQLRNLKALRAQARARQAAIEDLALATIIAVFVLVVLDPGLGVVAWFGLPLLLAGIIWLLVDRARERRHPSPLVDGGSSRKGTGGKAKPAARKSAVASGGQTRSKKPAGGKARGRARSNPSRGAAGRVRRDADDDEPAG